MNPKKRLKKRKPLHYSSDIEILDKNIDLKKEAIGHCLINISRYSGKKVLNHELHIESEENAFERFDAEKNSFFKRLFGKYS